MFDAHPGSPRIDPANLIMSPDTRTGPSSNLANSRPGPASTTAELPYLPSLESETTTASPESSAGASGSGPCQTTAATIQTAPAITSQGRVGGGGLASGGIKAP